MRNRLQIGRVRHRALPCRKPVRGRFAQQSSLRVMVCKDLGFLFNSICHMRLQNFGNPRVNLLAAASQQRVICHILDESVLEDVAGLGPNDPEKQDARSDQRIEGVVQSRAARTRNCLEQLIRDFSPDGRADLGYFFCLIEAIQLCCQRIL
jgi:hypothetical protein